MTATTTVCPECGTPVGQRERERARGWVTGPNVLGWAAVLVGLVWISLHLSISPPPFPTQHWDVPTGPLGGVGWTRPLLEHIAAGRLLTGRTIADATLDPLARRSARYGPYPGADAELVVGWTDQPGSPGLFVHSTRRGWPFPLLSEVTYVTPENAAATPVGPTPWTGAPSRDARHTIEWSLKYVRWSSPLPDGRSVRAWTIDPGAVLAVGMAGLLCGGGPNGARRLACRGCPRSRWWLPYAAAAALLVTYVATVPWSRADHFWIDGSGEASIAGIGTGLCVPEVLGLLEQEDADAALARAVLASAPGAPPTATLNAAWRDAYQSRLGGVEMECYLWPLWASHLLWTGSWSNELLMADGLTTPIAWAKRPLRTEVSGTQVMISFPVRDGDTEAYWCSLFLGEIAVAGLFLWAVWHIAWGALILCRRWATRRRFRRGLCVVCGYPVRAVAVKGG